MEKEKRFPKHFLADRAPLVIAAVLMIALMYLPNVAASSLTELFHIESGSTAMMVYCVLSILIAILLQLIFERWFAPEYKGSLGLNGFGYGLKMSIPVFLFWIIWMTVKALTKQAAFFPPNADAFLKGFRAGITEETCFRGIAVALLLRKYREKKNIWIPAVFTSVIFGLIHITNLTDVADTKELFGVLINSVFAGTYGLILGAIFTLSGCIWPPILVHSLYDTAVLLMENAESSPDWLVLVDIGGTVLLMIFYLILLKRHREKTCALWDRKWNANIKEN